MILEFSHVENPILRQLYDTYSFNVIPRIGGLVANDSESYQYLVESIRRFPTQVTLVNYRSKTRLLMHCNSFYYCHFKLDSNPNIAIDALGEISSVSGPTAITSLLFLYYNSSHNTRLHYLYKHSEPFIPDKNLFYLHNCCSGRSSTHGERRRIWVCFLH